MLLTRVVLPTPGPPVITSSLARRARRTASRWLGARPSPSLCSTQAIAGSASTAGQGGLPAARPRSRSAMPCSARYSPARNTHGAALDRVGHHRPVRQLQLEGGVDQLGRDRQQLGGERAQLVGGQAAMALVHGLGQGIADPGPGPDHRPGLDAEPHRDLVGTLEADAADVAREPVGVVADHLDGIGTIGLEDPHRTRGADAMAVQEQHDLADHLLLGPALDDALGALRTDPADLAQARGLVLDQVEHRLAERLHQPAGVDRADALDHAGAQVTLDALERGRRGGAQEGGLELQAVGAVVDPGARGLDELAGADRGRGADHRHQIPLAAHLDPQHAEAAVSGLWKVTRSTRPARASRSGCKDRSIHRVR